MIAVVVESVNGTTIVGFARAAAAVFATIVNVAAVVASAAFHSFAAGDWYWLAWPPLI